MLDNPDHRVSRRALLAAAWPAAVPASREPGLRIGGFEIAPLVMAGPLGGSPLIGALPEHLQRHVEPELPFALHWQPLMTFARAVRSLRDGSLDLLMLMSQDRTPGPGLRTFGWAVLQVEPQLAVLPDFPLREVLKVEALAGMKIGWIAHSRLPAGLEALPIRWVRLSTQHWQLAALRMLQAGRLDAVYFGNPHSPRYFARQQGLPVRLLPLPLTRRPLGLAHAQQADAAMVATFGRMAAPWFAEGRFERALLDYR